MKSQKPRIVLVPYPAQGHVSPMFQLAAAFHRHGFEAVLVTPEFIHSCIVRTNENRAVVDGVVMMSIPDGWESDQTPDFFTIDFAMENNQQLHLEQLLRSFDGDEGVVCVIADLLASYAIDVAHRCRIPAAGFWPAMLATYNLISAIPEMIRAGLVNEEGTPLQNRVVRYLPNQPMLSTMDLPWLVGPPHAQRFRFNFWLRSLQRSRTLQWLLVNSFPDEHIQAAQMALLSVCQGPPPGPHVLHVGPLTRQTTSNPSFREEDHSCVEWLGTQIHRSVIYVSFGSWVGPIGKERMGELLLGLEATRRPFLLVLDPTWQALLPSGFLERVMGRCKLVDWAPQRLVLGHSAIGCFLTHCGWNSTIEAIEGGKRLLCYPVSGDQFVNCAFIVRVWGIGVEVGGPGRMAIEEGVTKVMEESGEMHKRVMELKARVMGKEGSSRAERCLATFIQELGKSSMTDQYLPCTSSSSENLA